MRLITVLVLLALFSAATPVSAQADGPVYIVEVGDSLFTISLIFGTTVDELAAANQIDDPSAIFPGQELVIPGFEGLDGVMTFEEVLYGENLDSLALKHGLPSELLGRLNRVLNPQRLYSGQPFVHPENDDSLAGLAASQKQTALLGQPLLEIAMMMDLDPWALINRNEQGYRRWLVPGEVVFAPGDEQATSAIPPEFGIVTIRPNGAAQGRTLRVEFDSMPDPTVVALLGDTLLNIMEGSSGAGIAFQGVHALAEPGLIELQLGASGSVGYTQPVLLFDGDYGREAIQVPPETLDPKNTGPEDELVAVIVSEVTPDRLWEGPFSYPTTFFESFPSVFGTRRSYNGSDFIYYHTGLDLYGSSATPVLAPARGKVAFSDFLTVRGNVTYIDHGWGVYSGYLHQSESLVQPGDTVERGQIIGYVGGTGRATGPHLHWEVWVGGVPVDPVEWVAAEIP